MRRDWSMGTNVTVFLAFFGISLLEAFGSRNWVLAALWLAVGVLFLRADLLRGRTKIDRQ